MTAASTVLEGLPPGTPDFGGLITSIARSGDKGAFAHLFRHFAPRIKAYLRRQGADEATAEEVAQEALLQVWRKAALYDPARAGASTWIFTIARNLRIDLLRKERRPEVDPQDPLLVADPHPGADAALEAGQRDSKVADALRCLPPDQADVVRLSFFEDLSHSEIAERLSIPLGTVKSRLRLAFSKVRGEVGDLL